MLGPTPFSSQLADDRRARFTDEAARGRWRRLLRQRHPAPVCATLAAQLPDVVLVVTPTPLIDDEAVPR